MSSFMRASFLAVAVSAAAAPPAYSQNRRTLFQELDKAFDDVARRCLASKYNPGKLRKQRIGGQQIRTAIPLDILSYDAIEDNLLQEVEFSNDDALDTNWALVYRMVDGKRTALTQRLDIFWGQPQRASSVPFHDSETLTHNCVTMVSAKGGVKADSGMFQAATEAATNSATAVSTYTFAGRAVSPYAIAFGNPNYTALRLSPETARASYLSHLWLWYVRNPLLAREELETAAEIQAVSIYTTRNANQDALMRAQASASFGFGPVSGRVESEIDISSRIEGQSVDVETAVLARPRFTPLPKPLELAGILAQVLDLRTARLDNPEMIGSESFLYRAVLPNIPRTLCNSSFWGLTHDGSFSLEETRVDEDDSAEGCLFEWRLRASGSVASSNSLRLKVASTIGTETQTAKMEVRSPQVTLADRRALLSLTRPGFASISLPTTDAGTSVDHSGRYALVEVGNASLGSINVNASRLIVDCDGVKPYSPAITGAEISGGSGGRTLTLAFSYQPGFFDFVSRGARVTCSASGTVLGTRNGVSPGSVEVPLPSWSFTVTRGAAPAEAGLHD